MKSWKKKMAFFLAAIMALSNASVPSMASAEEADVVLLEDVKATQAFVLESEYLGGGDVMDYDGDGSITVFDIALLKRELLQTGVPSLTDFNSDRFEVLYGEKTDVLFTLNVVEIAPLAKDAVKIYDEDDNAVAVMYDNGKDGDEKAGDGVFTAKVSLYAEDFGTMNYYAAAEGVKSNSRRITFYRELEDAEFDGFFALMDVIAPMDYAEACAYIQTSAEIVSFYADEEQQVISFETVYHISGMWVPPMESEGVSAQELDNDAVVNDAAENDDAALPMYDPTEPPEENVAEEMPEADGVNGADIANSFIEDTTVNPLIEYEWFSEEGWELSPTCNEDHSEDSKFDYANAVAAHSKTGVAVICSYNDENDAGSSAIDAGNRIAEKLGSGSASVFQWKNNSLSNKVTLDQMTKLSEYGVVIISADSYIPKDGGLSSLNKKDNHYGDTYIQLGREKDKASSKAYSSELSSGDIKIVLCSDNWNLFVGRTYRYAIGKNFFTNHYGPGALRDSFWFLNCPELMGNAIKADTGFAAALTGRGVNAVVGLNSTITTMSGANDALNKIANKLLEGKTLSQATSGISGVVKKGNLQYRLFQSGTVKASSLPQQSKPSTDEMTWQIGNVTAHPGDYVHIPIYIYNPVDNMYGLRMEIDCDSPIFSIGAGYTGKSNDGYMYDKFRNFKTETIAWREDIQREDGSVLVCLGFGVPEDCEAGIYSIRFKSADAYILNGLDNPVLINGSITVGTQGNYI